MSSIVKFPHEWPNDLRLGILGNKEILRKYQIWVETCLPVSSLPSRNQTLAIAVKKYAKVDIKLLLVRYSFTRFLYFVPNILSRIVVLQFLKFKSRFFLVL